MPRARCEIKNCGNVEEVSDALVKVLDEGGKFICRTCLVKRINAAARDALTPLDVQVGGGHYKDLPIQPARYCHLNGVGKLEGDVVYYVTRWRSKNGVEDLKKARHTLDILIALEEEKRDG